MPALKVVVLILAALITIISIMGIGTRKKLQNFLGDFKMENSKELIDDAKIIKQ